MVIRTPEELALEAAYDRNTYKGPLPQPKVKEETKVHPLAGKTPGVRSTSRQALKHIQHELGERQREVYVAIQMSSRPVNDRELSEYLSMAISSVTARRNELVELGKVREAFRDTDPKTKRRTIYWEVAR